MHLIKSMPFLLIIGLCLSMASGCKMLTPPGMNNSGQNLSIKRRRPARRHKPKNLNARRAMARNTKDRTVTNNLGELEPASKEQGIGIDDVLLDESTVHVDADMDIDSLEGDSKKQLPKIIESAVHPFAGIKKSFTFSDQLSKMEGKANSPVPPTEEPQPERLSHQPDAEPLDSNIALDPDADTPPMMRIVAQTDSGDSKDRAAVKTDRLFSQSSTSTTIQTGSEISVSPPPLTKNNQVIQSQKSAEIESKSTIQTTAHSSQNSQTPQISTINNELPASHFASHVTGPPPSELPNTRPPKNSNIGVSSPTVSSPTVSSPPKSQTTGETSLTWDQQVLAAIDRLEAESRALGKPLDINEQARVELLRIVVGDRSSANQILQGQDVKLQQFWQHQLAAIDELLAPLPESVSSQAAVVAEQRKNMTNASAHLEKAQSQLADLATLTVAKCAFASEVRGFGQFTELTPTFEPGQQVLLYSELENYSLRKGEVAGQPQLIAELQGQFSIMDEQNRVVYQYQYQPVQDYSLRRRNDFYMFFPITIPDLPIGKYRLHLQVDDLVGKKFASYRESMVFTVQGRTRRPQPKITNSRPPRRFARPESATVPNLAKMMAVDAENTKQQQKKATTESQPPARLPLADAGNPPLPLDASEESQGPVPLEQTLTADPLGTERSANNENGASTEPAAVKKRR